MLGCFNPFLCFGFEYLYWHTRQYRCQNFFKVAQRQLSHRLVIAGKRSLKGLAVLKLWFLRYYHRHTLQAINNLRVHRMFDPQRTVLIEGRNALFGRHEIRTLKSPS